jgi:hypothetical protein
LVPSWGHLSQRPLRHRRPQKRHPQELSLRHPLHHQSLELHLTRTNCGWRICKYSDHAFFISASRWSRKYDPSSPFTSIPSAKSLGSASGTPGFGSALRNPGPFQTCL